MINCMNCGEETDNPKFCNLSCSSKYNMNINKDSLPDEIRKCLKCSSEFAVRPWDKKKFCSRSCSASFNNKARVKVPKVCSFCGKELPNKVNKFCDSTCFASATKQDTLNNFLDGTSKTLSPSAVIYDYILERQSGVCQICSIPPVWGGMPLKFIRDHIDGNSENNHPDNIRLICHNCDSQLDTYKSKNNGNGRHSRRQRYAEGKSY